MGAKNLIAYCQQICKSATVPKYLFSIYLLSIELMNTTKGLVGQHSNFKQTSHNRFQRHILSKLNQRNQVKQFRFCFQTFQWPSQFNNKIKRIVYTRLNTKRVSHQWLSKKRQVWNRLSSMIAFLCNHYWSVTTLEVPFSEKIHTFSHFLETHYTTLIIRWQQYVLKAFKVLYKL